MKRPQLVSSTYELLQIWAEIMLKKHGTKIAKIDNIFLINIDVKIHNKILMIQIQQHIKIWSSCIYYRDSEMVKHKK